MRRLSPGESPLPSDLGPQACAPWALLLVRRPGTSWPSPSPPRALWTCSLFGRTPSLSAWSQVAWPEAGLPSGRLLWPSSLPRPCLDSPQIPGLKTSASLTPRAGPAPHPHGQPQWAGAGGPGSLGSATGQLHTVGPGSHQSWDTGEASYGCPPVTASCPGREEDRVGMGPLPDTQVRGSFPQRATLSATCKSRDPSSDALMWSLWAM